MTTTNGESVKVDTKQRIMGNKLAPVDDSGGLALLPTNNDWIEFPAASDAFTYSSPDGINITGITPSDRFQIGDKLRIKQTTYKYFHIIAIGATDIDVRAGNDYTVANAAITEFAISRLVNPEGFPGAFSYTPNIEDEDGTTIPFSGSGEATGEFIMNGQQVTLNINFFDLNVPANTDTIFVSYPVLHPITQSLAYRTIIDVDNAGTHRTCMVTVTRDPLSVQLAINKPDLSVFTAGNTDTTFTVIFQL